MRKDKRNFTVHITDDEAAVLLAYEQYQTFGWTLQDLVESALGRGIDSIALEVGEHIAYQEALEERDQ